jgi:hypothetical protein
MNFRMDLRATLRGDGRDAARVDQHIAKMWLVLADRAIVVPHAARAEWDHMLAERGGGSATEAAEAAHAAVRAAADGFAAAWACTAAINAAWAAQAAGLAVEAAWDAADCVEDPAYAENDGASEGCVAHAAAVDTALSPRATDCEKFVWGEVDPIWADVLDGVFAAVTYAEMAGGADHRAVWAPPWP